MNFTRFPRPVEIFSSPEDPAPRRVTAQRVFEALWVWDGWTEVATADGVEGETEWVPGHALGRHVPAYIDPYFGYDMFWGPPVLRIHRPDGTNVLTTRGRVEVLGVGRELPYRVRHHVGWVRSDGAVVVPEIREVEGWQEPER